MLSNQIWLQHLCLFCSAVYEYAGEREEEKRNRTWIWMMMTVRENWITIFLVVVAGEGEMERENAEVFPDYRKVSNYSKYAINKQSKEFFPWF